MFPFLNMNLVDFISRVFVLVTAFSVHEFAHAWTANYFGDDTPRYNGRLTLNPLKHLDPLGSIMLMLVGFGWAKPVPVNPYALQRRSPAALMWVSLAGPMSNLLMAILAAVLFRLMMLVYGNIQSQTVLGFGLLVLYDFISINLLLMLFNLIPIAPLDGEKVAEYLLPPSASQVLESIRPFGPMILMAVLFIGPMVGLPIINWIITGPMNALLGLLVGIN